MLGYGKGLRYVKGHLIQQKGHLFQPFFRSSIDDFSLYEACIIERILTFASSSIETYHKSSSSSIETDHKSSSSSIETDHKSSSSEYQTDQTIASSALVFRTKELEIFFSECVI